MSAVPREVESSVPLLKKKLEGIRGVKSLEEFHCWRHASKEVVGTVHLQIADVGHNEEVILKEALALLAQYGITNPAVQVQKKSFQNFGTSY